MLLPDVMPTIILKGSDYEMGYQYGQQAGHYIEIRKNEMWAKVLKRGDDRHPTVTNRDEALHDLKAFQHYISTYAPEQIDQLKGIVAGAKSEGHSVSFADILLINTGINRRRPPCDYPEGAEAEELSLDGCCTWLAMGSTTKNGELICGDSFDGPFTFQIVIVAFPDEGHNFMTSVMAGELGSHFAMNNQGVYFGNSGGDGRRDIDFGYGIPWTCAIQHLARFADSAALAKDMLMPWKISLPENFVFADIHSQAFVVETTAAIKSVRVPGDFGETDFLYTTNNFLTSAMESACNPIGESRHVDHAGWPGRLSVSRNLQLWNMLHQYGGHVDLDFAKMMWRFPGTSAVQSETCTGPMICRMNNTRVGILLPAKSDQARAYICTGPAGRVIDYFEQSTFPIAMTHSFFQLTLAGDPLAVVEASQREAREDVARAQQELMKISDKEGRYPFLQDVLSRANSETYEGDCAYNLGILTCGNEALFHFASAATSFAKAQSHSRQAKNAMKPPAANPQELGLPPLVKWEDN